MSQAELPRLVLIRHAEALTDGCVAGRRDVEALPLSEPRIAAMRQLIGPVDRVHVSPAKRCQSTAAALFPDQQLISDTRLWEQNFGAWEGHEYKALPDLGMLSGADLALHRPPGGESFADLCKRVIPMLHEAAEPGSTAIVAHAGTVRAALATAIGHPGAALAFEIAPLSATALIVLPGGGFSIAYVNRIACC